MTLVCIVLIAALVFEYINGFHDAADAIASVISTTHVISTSIMGVGSTKRLSAVKWGIIHRIVWASGLTIPITALLAYFIHGGAKYIR